MNDCCDNVLVSISDEEIVKLVISDAPSVTVTITDGGEPGAKGEKGEKGDPGSPTSGFLAVKDIGLNSYLQIADEPSGQGTIYQEVVYATAMTTMDIVRLFAR
jgi:hypothetical protein